MILLILFAFLAGIVTVLSPCILPLLPIILSSSDASGKQKPIGVVVGFVASFTFFTLFLSTLVRISGIPVDSLRFISILVLAIFGVTLLIPQIQSYIEIFFSRLANLGPSNQKRTGFVGGVLIGLSLGLLWTPCVGPILASVISLAITGTVTTQAFLITLAYAVGTALPMLMIMLAGSAALQKVPWLLRNMSRIQKGFGILMILTAVGIYFNVDRRFQTYILQTFPNYGVGLTALEDRPAVRKQLDGLHGDPVESQDRGRSLNEVMDKGLVAPELIQGGEWFNSVPLQLTDLKGKVVLLDFWTYSCINCQRTFPYLRDWWKKYQDQGLVIIGVHAPEFEFEKNPQNVQQAITDFELAYPVMQDNDFATWKAYRNRYWPAKYLIDKDGRIRYTHFGEGKYDETERMIQALLKETGSDVSNQVVSNPSYQIESRTPELYLGATRIQYLVSPERVIADALTTFTAPPELPTNTFAYQGQWLISSEFSAPKQGARLTLDFDAKEVFLVARPKGAAPGSMKVSLDGQPQAFGQDNQNGQVTVDADKLYKLINLSQADRHILDIEFLDSNLELYAFTFG